MLVRTKNINGMINLDNGKFFLIVYNIQDSWGRHAEKVVKNWLGTTMSIKYQQKST
jgi:hypothetical protein